MPLAGLAGRSSRPVRTHGNPLTVAASLLAMVTVAAGLSISTEAPSAQAVEAPVDTGSRFTLAVLPDTQFYSRYAASQFERPDRYGPGNNPFAEQTQWLAANADELEIPFVAHLGDVVDQVNQDGEWQTADRAMRTLDDADLPYSILAGNHDVRDSSDTVYDTDYNLAQEPYLKYFGADRAAQQATYGGSDPTGFNQYHVFEAEGQQFMVLALSWRASDATLDWAEQVMDAHPTVPVILTSHEVIDIESDGVTPKDTPYGLRLWDELIRSNDQIFMTLNGHFHGAARQTKLNDAGNPVTQIVIDYQMAYEGGNGYLGLFEFDLTNNRISVQTGSPWVVSKPASMLTSYDQAFLEGPNQQFTLDLDFRDRFSAFNPSFTAGSPDEPSLTQKARDILLNGFTAPEAPVVVPPASPSDYPEVDGTLAHWRMNGKEGVLPAGGTVPDITAGSHLTRATTAESGSRTAQENDVTINGDAHPLSSDSAAMCFTGSSRTTNRYSYLTTDDQAPVNNASLPNGYTIETFLKIDSSWTEDDNAWMKAIVRSGNRSKIGVPRTRWDWTASPVALGLSSLKEFQWTEVPMDTSKGDRTNWSGEIILDRWVHMALVNEPDTAMTTMYVDGAPVLRIATDTVGHGLQENMPWLFGSDWVDDKGTNGWNGCIGETRVVDHPLEQSQWLTARADLNNLTVTSPGDGSTTKPVKKITGTGIPGASITMTGDATATTTVDDEGRWAINIKKPILPGNRSLTITQKLADRSSEPLTVRFRAGGKPTAD